MTNIIIVKKECWKTNIDIDNNNENNRMSKFSGNFENTINFSLFLLKTKNIYRFYQKYAVFEKYWK